MPIEFNRIGFAVSWMLLIAILVFLNDQCFAENPNNSIESIQIIVHENSLVDTKEIFLGQISAINAGGFLTDALDRLVVAKSPKPDQIIAIEKRKILSLIQSQAYLPDDVAVSCPDRVYVKRPGQTISRAMIQTYIEKKISAELNHQTFTIEKVDIRGLERYPAGEVSFTNESAPLVSKKGNLSLFLDVQINGTKVDRLNIKGKIAVFNNVYCAATDLKKNQIVTAEDFRLQEKNIYQLKEGYLVDLSVVKDKRMKSAMKKGDALTHAHLAKIHMVKKGDIVTLIAKNNNLTIVTSGISQENGYESALVKVENLSSGKLVRGIVTDKSKVEVVY